ELSAICIACGGGIQLGAAVLFPGQNTRAEALRIAGRDAAKLAIIAALMLIAAALIEGFGRQLIQDRNARLIIGWTIGGLWLMWFIRGGRTQS
ncbi:MAG: stage II sporulation protein M, partial [Pseudomonadota bacterium]